MDYATLKAQIKAELKLELRDELMAELLGFMFAKLGTADEVKPSTVCFSIQLNSHADYGKLESDQKAFGVFMKWYGKQKGYDHPRHAFNSLCKHYGFVLVERDPAGEWVKAGTKSWKV